MNNWHKKLKKKAILPAAAFLMAAAAIGTTFAWRTWDLSITNNLKAHETKVIIDETGFNPLTGKKPVVFKNDGSSSVYLRVAYSEYWIADEKEVQADQSKHWGYNEHEQPTWEHENTSTKVLSNKDANGNDIAVKTWTSAWETDWEKGNDGWYYYKKVLLAGEKTDPILDSVSIVKVPEEYQKANYRLFFKAEVVQCSDGSNTLNSDQVNADALQKLFKMQADADTTTDGTLTWTESPEPQPTQSSEGGEG